MAKIIVSYDGTHNEEDAIALGRVFSEAGAEVAIAYVRHTHEEQSGREAQAQHRAEALVEHGVDLLGDPDADHHVVVHRSTPQGLRELAEREGADMIVFCSDSHTAKGHITVGNSAERLLDGGPLAIAIAPAGYASAGTEVKRIAATGPDGDTSAADTAQELAERIGATVVPLASEDVDLIVVGARPEAPQGQVQISAASEYLLEISRCPVLVLPRGVPIEFGSSVSLSA